MENRPFLLGEKVFLMEEKVREKVGAGEGETEMPWWVGGWVGGLYRR